MADKKSYGGGNAGDLKGAVGYLGKSCHKAEPPSAGSMAPKDKASGTYPTTGLPNPPNQALGGKKS